jgi:hypothetical protein
MNEEHSELLDELEAKETANRLPTGWVLLVVGLILWGIFYVYLYTPAISGWSQEQAYEESVK